MGSIYLTSADRQMVDQVYFYFFYLKKKLEFQFLPIITGDGRQMEWIEHKSGYGADPTVHYGGNSCREMNMKIEYILEDDTEGAGFWNVARIKKNINYLKGIFTAFRSDIAGMRAVDEDNGGDLLVKFGYPMITGLEPKSMRVKSVVVEYSNEKLMVPFNGKNVMYPLKSTVNLSMATYTNSKIEEPTTDWATASLFPKLDDLWY